MIERAKKAFVNMDGWAKAYLLYAYFAGLAFFIMAWMFGQGFFGVGILVGVFSALIIEPALETINKGNRAREIKDIFRFKLARCVMFSLFISYLLALIRYTIASSMIHFYFEPISFGLAYAFLHVLIISILRKVWHRIRRR